jgi:hypothetical protein
VNIADGLGFRPQLAVENGFLLRFIERIRLRGWIMATRQGGERMRGHWKISWDASRKRESKMDATAALSAPLFEVSPDCTPL